MTLLQINYQYFFGRRAVERLRRSLRGGLARGEILTGRWSCAISQKNRCRNRRGALRRIPCEAGRAHAAQQEVVDYSDALIDELERADVIVQGLPMYNFGVPPR
jgi:hypothetical protein